MAMLRAAVIVPLFLSVSSFKLVSQIFNGNVTMNSSTPGAPVPTISTVYLGLDMENVRLREDVKVVIEMPQINLTVTSQNAMIFDTTAKRYTSFVMTVTTGPAPSLTKECTYYDLPKLHGPATVAKCMQLAAALSLPVSTESGLDKYELKVSVPGANTSTDEVVDWYMDKSSILKKASVDVKLTGAMNATILTRVEDMNSKAGAPDQTMFTLPMEWGICKEGSTPPIPGDMPPMFRVFIHCMGLDEGTDVILV